jgi:hypothetical protein
LQWLGRGFKFLEIWCDLKEFVAESLHFPFVNCQMPLAFTQEIQLILNLKAGVSSLLSSRPPETSGLLWLIWYVPRFGDKPWTSKQFDSSRGTLQDIRSYTVTAYTEASLLSSQSPSQTEWFLTMAKTGAVAQPEELEAPAASVLSWFRLYDLGMGNFNESDTVYQVVNP